MKKTLTVRHEVEIYGDTRMPDPHQDTYSKTFLGFWIYLMTDCLIFATLFITYAVLHIQTFGGPSGRDIFDLHSVFAETMLLLFSSATCGFAVIAGTRNNVKGAIFWLLVTFLLGASFVALELHEFSGLVAEGYSWKRSAFLSSFFTLVGTHGAHVSTGLLWIAVMIGQLIKQGIGIETFRRLVIFSLFWHFLDVVWIFIFTFVYLMGVI